MNEGRVRLYLGAGKDRKEGFTHIDMYPFEGIDILMDVTKGIQLPDGKVDEIYTQDFLEHIPEDKKVFVINEMWRVLKNGGLMEHFIPNAGSRNDFGSPSHISHWNLQQFEHFDIGSYRYEVDHDYEGFIGKFKKVIAEEVNPQPDNFGMMMQSIHVIYRAVKE